MEKFKSLNSYIKDVETTNDVSSLQYKNIHVWLGLRNLIYARRNKGFYDSRANFFRDFLLLLKNSFRGLRYWFFHYDFWFISSVQAKRELEGKWTDIYLDYINQKLENSWALEYTTNAHFPRNKSLNKRISSQIPILILEKICRPLFLDKGKIRDIRKSLISMLGEDELKHINLEHHVFKIYFQYAFMRFILKIKKAPKLAFIVASYNNFGFIRALKENNVHVIEAQHGVISKEHYGYHIYADFPKNYFPDDLLSFGEENIANGTFLKHTRIIPVGSYIIDHYVHNYASTYKNLKYKEFELIFSVALQDCDTGMQLLPILIKIARKHSKFLFILKPRRTSIEYYQKNYDLSSNMIFSDWDNIYELIIHSDYHLSAYSSTSIEAPALGISNILFNINNKARSYYEDQLKEGINTSYLEDADAFTQIDWTKSIPGKKSMVESHTHIMKTAYQNNVNEFLESLPTEN